MKRNKKQRRERIYRVRNLKEKTAQNKQYTAKHTAAVTADEIKWKWWWAKKITKIKTTTITTATAATAVMTAANWVKKSSCLNRVSKEIRIRIEIKSIYDEAICFLNIYFIKKEINRQKVTTDEFRLQSVYNKFFVVQWAHKTYSVICTHNLFIFTQWSYLDRTVCSALRIIYAVFFDLIFFLHTYQERSFFSFFFFFSIDLKKITTHNINTDLMKQQRSNDDSEADAAAAARKEV